MSCPYCLTDDCSQSPIFAADKAARVANLQASIDALGNRGKPGRERYVVREFLLNVKVPFLDADIASVPEGQDPPDVLFDGAQFEVKELYETDRRRMDEYMQRLIEAQRAERCAELHSSTPYAPTDTTLAEVLELAVTIGAAHSQRYDPALVPNLDLLLYYNLVGVMGMYDETFPTTDRLTHQGWRSVSVLFGHRSIVFCAATNAPAWLRMAVGSVTHRT